jgi:hypothetical protein
MELLMVAILVVTDPNEAALDRAVHYGRLAEGLVRVRTNNWKTLGDVIESLGQDKSQCLLSAPFDNICVLESKDLGVVFRFATENGLPCRVVDVKWHFRPFDPNDPRFPVFKRKALQGTRIAVDQID